MLTVRKQLGFPDIRLRQNLPVEVAFYKLTMLPLFQVSKTLYADEQTGLALCHIRFYPRYSVQKNISDITAGPLCLTLRAVLGYPILLFFGLQQ